MSSLVILAGTLLAPASPAEQVERLIRQQEKAMLDFQKRLQAASTPPRRAEALRSFPSPDAAAEKLVRLAERHPKDRAAVTALLWVVRNASQGGPWKPRARDALIRDHLRHPDIGALCQALKYEDRNAEAERTIRKVLKENPHEAAQAHAALSLAYLLQSRLRLVHQLKKASAKELANFEKAFGKETTATFRKENLGKLEGEAERLYGLVSRTREYASVKVDYGGEEVALGALARRFLFRMRNLQPGKPAPATVGIDLDGNRMALARFRGKVVLLAFWGHWCGPCHEFYPFGRALAKKYRGRPFVLVGVNSDPRRAAAKRTLREEKLDWPAFWDGGSTAGPISSGWGVDAWPTAYLIDEKGVIVQEVGRPSEQLEELIEKQVRRAEAAGKK